MAGGWWSHTGGEGVIFSLRRDSYTRRPTSSTFDQETMWHLSTAIVTDPLQ